VTSEETGRISFSEAIQKTFRPYVEGESFGPLWATYWFRVEFDQPDGEIHLLWDSGSEATLWTENGVPVQGFNGADGVDRRAEYILPSGAGSHCVYYVELACNGNFGGGNGLIAVPDNTRTYSIKEVALGRFNRPNWDLLSDLVVFFDMCKHLKDTPRGEEAVYVGNKIYDIMRKTGDLAAARQIAFDFFQ
jgi:alpha-mannosidase